jgi:hypothetical protein
MYECKREFGTAFVRIGVTGNGRAPYYRIEYTKDSSVHWIYGVYFGLGHQKRDDLVEFAEFSLQQLDDLENERPVENEKHRRFLQYGHWSSQAMQLDEVAIVLGELRRRNV